MTLEISSGTIMHSAVTIKASRQQGIPLPDIYTFGPVPDP